MLLLGRQNLLREPDGVDGTQHRSSGRQIGRPKRKVCVEAVQTIGRTVYGAAVLIRSDRLAIVVEAHQRTFVIAVDAAPIFQETQEVMHAAIGAKVSGPEPGWQRKRDPLAANQSHAVSRLHRGAVCNVVGTGEAVHVVPVVRKQGYGVARNGCSNCAGTGKAAAGRVVIALHVYRVLGGDRQTARRIGTGAVAGGAEVESNSVHDLQSATKKERRIFSRFLNVNIGGARPEKRVVRGAIWIL